MQFTVSQVKENQYATIRYEYCPSGLQYHTGESHGASLWTLETPTVFSMKRWLVFWLLRSATAVVCSPADPGESMETESRWSVEAKEVLARTIKPYPAVPLTQNQEKNSFFQLSISIYIYIYMHIHTYVYIHLPVNCWGLWVYPSSLWNV